MELGRREEGRGRRGSHVSRGQMHTLPVSLRDRAWEVGSVFGMDRMGLVELLP